MSVHDWTRVDAGIFHAFRHSWIEELKRALNGGILPQGHYAMVERLAADPCPDVQEAAETDMEFYRRKQNAVAVRHVSGDRMVAVVEVVSPGNKAGRAALRSLVEKAAALLDHRIHLLILDLHPPTPRDPQGIHGAIWEEVSGEEYAAPPGKPLTLAAYESGVTLRAYVEPVSVGDALIEMPLFLEPGAHVPAPPGNHVPARLRRPARAVAGSAGERVILWPAGENLCAFPGREKWSAPPRLSKDNCPPHGRRALRLDSLPREGLSNSGIDKRSLIGYSAGVRVGT